MEATWAQQEAGTGVLRPSMGCHSILSPFPASDKHGEFSQGLTLVDVDVKEPGPSVLREAVSLVSIPGAHRGYARYQVITVGLTIKQQ